MESYHPIAFSSPEQLAAGCGGPVSIGSDRPEKYRGFARWTMFPPGWPEYGGPTYLNDIVKIREVAKSTWFHSCSCRQQRVFCPCHVNSGNGRSKEDPGSNLTEMLVATWS